MSTSPSVTRIVWSLLLHEEKRRLIVVFLLIFAGMLLETFSVGMIVPVIALLADDNSAERYRGIYTMLGNPSRESLISVAMLLLLLLYVFKSVFQAGSTWIQQGFSARLSTRLAQNLFASYLKRPYEFHVQHNSSLLITNVQNTGQFVSGALGPMMTIISDGIVAIGLLVLMTLLEPWGTAASLVVLGIIAYVFHRFTREKINEWGEAGIYHKSQVIRHLQQGFGGVKEIKVLRRESEFISDHQRHVAELQRVNRLFLTLSSLPRMTLEVLAISGVTVLVLVMTAQEKTTSEILPVLGLFAASSFRLAPAINRLVTSVQQIIYCRPVLLQLSGDLLVAKQKSLDVGKPNVHFEKLVLDNITYRYVGANVDAVSAVSLEISRGEAVGIMGSSGAGKSTLVDLILGLYEPLSGSIRVNDCDIRTIAEAWLGTVGYVPQSFFLADDSIFRNVAFGLPSEAIDVEAVWAALSQAQLSEFVVSLPDGINTVVGERGVRLSGGQRQRIAIARALYGNPDVLIFDEATASLDLETEAGVIEAIAQLKGDKTLIVIAHRFSTLEHCDRVVQMIDGRLDALSTNKGKPSWRESTRSDDVV